MQSIKRDALYIDGALPRPVVGGGGVSPGPLQAAGSQPSEPAGRAGSIVHGLCDGTARRCKNKKTDCPKGVHRSAVVLKPGCACGSWQHVPAKCPSKA